MSTTTLNYTNATQLLEQGRAKDAYAAFLSVVESSTQQLYGVKFVHQTIVSRPQEYDQSIALLRSSLDQLEKIAIHKLPGAVHGNNSQKVRSPPPPVPPKPTAIHQKPTIPPRPTKEVSPPPPPPPRRPSDTPQKRARGNSVSFAENSKLLQMTIIENDEENAQLASEIGETNKDSELDDDDDDDDMAIEFENTTVTRSPPRPSTTIGNSTIPPIKMRNRSKTWVVQSDSSTKGEAIDVLLETVVDPCNLVPAQTNTGDSLAIPTNSQANDYVPNIPAPPLLATHRRLQHRLNELESDLEANSDGLLRSERSNRVHCARQTLEKVRTLYMSAMTIPSMLQFPPQLIAYQLTLIESSIFRGIPREALLSHSARTPHKKVVASTDFFNFITRSIEHSILLPQEASRRAEIMHRWIKIATKLLALNNYQTLKAVISALGTPPVKRLRRTWECIPKKRMGRLDLLNNLMSEADNYRKYREHMGLERKRLWAKPVVPFLGVFIHDVTYLHAAAKGNQHDTRVQDVLDNVQLFQRAPEYPQQPPASFVNVQKRHLFRPMSDALHFGSSSKKINNRSTTAALMGEDQRQETEIELEQQLIVQYLLMRPWVSEKTIDALSNLREPPKPRSISSPTSSRYNSDSNISIAISTRPGSNILTSNSSGSGNSTPTAVMSPSALSNNGSSILSNASSFIRFNSNNTNHNNETPAVAASAVDQTIPIEENKKSIVGGFWPFRKSTDMSRSSINTDTTFSSQDQTWSEEDDDDDEEEPANSAEDKHGTLGTRGNSRPASVHSKIRGHNRSISLPSKSILVSDLYRPS